MAKRGEQATTATRAAARPIVYAGLTDEELKDAVLLEHPAGHNRWVLNKLVDKCLKWGYKRANVTPSEARPHDNLAFTMQGDKPAPKATSKVTKAGD